ncbi:MAG TPA: carboxypeptidase regulatory-like domain-containing protein [Polyangiales bacterium]|nr:carboxypeptidase regulatory-like domain-containing protein [Polyangiales bacterium]
MDVQGLRGGRYVGSAAPVGSDPRAILGLGYAYTESVLGGTDKHQRVFGEAAAAWAPWQYLQLSLGFDARYDKHSAPSDSGAALGTQIATRHAYQLDDHWAFGARTAFRFPPATDVGHGFKAVSPELGAIATYLFEPAQELSLNLGYRIDRSQEVVDQPLRLSPGDRLAAQISAYDALLLGVLYAMPIGPVTASAEWSWDVATGSGAPSAMDSPMRIRLAAQLKLKERFLPGIELGVSPSGRPDLGTGNSSTGTPLARVEPRMWFALTCGIRFARAKAEQATAQPEQPVVVDAKGEPALVEVKVLDPNGAPVNGAQVQLAVEGERKEARTDAEGVAELELRPTLEHTLSVTAEGFQQQSVMVQGTAGRQTVNVSLARVLPEGEIKGNVRSLRGGQPVKARITLAPLGTIVNTDDKGNFVVDVPPGQYTLEIEAQGYEPQTRAAQVERLGVTIIVVDLRRAPK